MVDILRKMQDYVLEQLNQSSLDEQVIHLFNKHLMSTSMCHWELANEADKNSCPQGAGIPRRKRGRKRRRRRADNEQIPSVRR